MNCSHTYTCACSNWLVLIICTRARIGGRGKLAWHPGLGKDWKEKRAKEATSSPLFTPSIFPRASPTRRLPSLVFKRSKREGWGYVSPFGFPLLIFKRDKTNHWGLVSSFNFSFYSSFDILPKRYLKNDTWLVVSDDFVYFKYWFGLHTKRNKHETRWLATENSIRP